MEQPVEQCVRYGLLYAVSCMGSEGLRRAAVGEHGMRLRRFVASSTRRRRRLGEAVG